MDRNNLVALGGYDNAMYIIGGSLIEEQRQLHYYYYSSPRSGHVPMNVMPKGDQAIDSSPMKTIIKVK